MARRIFFVSLIFFVFSCASGTTNDPCKNPEYIKILKDKIQVDLSNNETAEALKSAKEIEKCSPKDPELYYWLGRIYLTRQEYDKSKEYFFYALKLKPNYSEVNMALGMIFLIQEDYQSAIEQYKKAASDDLFQEAYVAFNNLGNIYIKLGKLDEAEQALQRSLILNPNFCYTYCNLGELRSLQKKYDEAVNHYKKALKLCPELPRAHLLMGVEYSRRGQIQLACYEFYRVRKKAPETSEEHKKAFSYLKILNCPEAQFPIPP